MRDKKDPPIPGCYVDKRHIAVLMSNVAHPAPAGLAPGPGAPTVFWNGHPVWRIMTDKHVCPLFNGPVPHVPPTGAPVIKTSETARACGPNPIVGDLAVGATAVEACRRSAAVK